MENNFLFACLRLQGYNAAQKRGKAVWPLGVRTRLDTRRQDVTYWLALVVIAVGIVALMLFLFRERFAARRMEKERGRALQTTVREASPGPSATPTVTPAEGAVATATPTPRTPARDGAVPTSVPGRDSLREDTIRLREITSNWAYRGYAQMGPRGIGSFSRSAQAGDTFTAARGDTVDEVTVDVLDRTRAVLRLRQATLELLIKPEEAEPTPLPPAQVRIRPGRRVPPTEPDTRFTEPDAANLSQQETPFE